MTIDRIIIIRDKTRLEQLIERFNSKGQARFYIESNGGDFKSYEDEHSNFYNSLQSVESYFSGKYKVQVLFRSFLPTHIFSKTDMVVVIGQDGLVANTAKYLEGKPMLCINPDESRYDGILLQCGLHTFKKTFENFLKGTALIKEITMAKAKLNDGQELLAFNDFYIGASSHVSSRYKIHFGNKEEVQSSSGIIVSTGAGSTGWLSSVVNMANNIDGLLNRPVTQGKVGLEWNDEALIFVVREPFKSKASDTSVGCGKITSQAPLTVESQMMNGGVIFSDGLESDFISFNAGARVKMTVAEEKARLISLN